MEKFWASSDSRAPRRFAQHVRWLPQSMRQGRSLAGSSEGVLFLDFIRVAANRAYSWVHAPPQAANVFSSQLSTATARWDLCGFTSPNSAMRLELRRE